MNTSTQIKPLNEESEYTEYLFPITPVERLSPIITLHSGVENNGKYGEQIYRLKPEASLEKLHPTLSDRALYGVLGDIVKKVDPFTEAHPAALLLQLLAGTGTIIGRGCKLAYNNTTHHTNLFTIITGDSAKGRKGTSLRLSRQTLRAIDPDWDEDHVISGLGSGQAIIGALRDDPNNTDKRLLIIEEEYSKLMEVMSKSGATLSQTIRDVWDNGNLHSSTKNCILKASNCHVSLIGHITREEFSALMDRKKSKLDLKNGLVNRVLWCFSHQSKKLRRVEEMPKDLLQPEHTKLKEAIASIRSGEFTFSLSEEAWELMDQEMDSIEVGDYGVSTDTDHRGTQHVLRIALIFALLDQDMEVKPDHLAAAIAIWNYCKKSARWVFEDHEFSLLANKLFVALERGPLTYQEIYDKVFGKNLRKIRVNKIIGEISHLLEEQKNLNK